MSREDEVRMTANNVLHSCSPGTKCAIKIAAPAFEPRLEAAKVDLGEKHEPRGDGEPAGRKWRLVDGQTAIREGRYGSLSIGEGAFFLRQERDLRDLRISRN
jgi:hypothetical protein